LAVEAILSDVHESRAKTGLSGLHSVHWRQSGRPATFQFGRDYRQRFSRRDWTHWPWAWHTRWLRVNCKQQRRDLTPQGGTFTSAPRSL